MLENIYRYLEQGDDALKAALKGAGEIGFYDRLDHDFADRGLYTDFVYGGVIGRLFREFGVTVAVAIVLSAVIALTLSPTMAALFLSIHDPLNTAGCTNGASAHSRGYFMATNAC